MTGLEHSFGVDSHLLVFSDSNRKP